MASRLERVGTIFTRVNGLIRAGVMKREDAPLWYDVYERFPPHDEPLFFRPTPNIEIPQIFYAGDQVRAFLRKHGNVNKIEDLSDATHRTRLQKYVEEYETLLSQGVSETEATEKILKLIIEPRSKPPSEEKSKIRLPDLFFF